MLDVPSGKNDGRVQGVKYFECKPKHGLFVRTDKCRLLRKRGGVAAPAEQEDDGGGGVGGSSSSAAAAAVSSCEVSGAGMPEVNGTYHPVQSAGAEVLPWTSLLRERTSRGGQRTEVTRRTLCDSARPVSTRTVTGGGGR